MTTIIDRRIQSSSPGNRVELYDIDFNPIGLNTVLHFSPSSNGPDDIVFGGTLYPSRPIMTSGFEVNGQGNAPEPKLTMINVNNVAGALMEGYDDLVGILVTRRVTFRYALDDGETPDSAAHLPAEIYEIVQKTKQNRTIVEWRLGAPGLRQNAFLPKRRVLQSVCPWLYRRWDPVAETWDYSHATCPYTGEDMFKLDGTSTMDPTQDLAAKNVTHCCIPRFGENGVLPFGGFPGVNGRRDS